LKKPQKNEFFLNKSRSFSEKNEKKDEKILDFLKENQEFSKSLHEIEVFAFETPKKEEKNEANTLKSPSFSKKTLKVVIESYKRSPSILFSAPMENIYLIEVFSKKKSNEIFYKKLRKSLKKPKNFFKKEKKNQ